MGLARGGDATLSVEIGQTSLWCWRSQIERCRHAPWTLSYACRSAHRGTAFPPAPGQNAGYPTCRRCRQEEHRLRPSPDRTYAGEALRNLLLNKRACPANWCQNHYRRLPRHCVSSGSIGAPCCPPLQHDRGACCRLSVPTGHHGNGLCASALESPIPSEPEARSLEPSPILHPSAWQSLQMKPHL
jgi:hypothetical protein